MSQVIGELIIADPVVLAIAPPVRVGLTVTPPALLSLNPTPPASILVVPARQGPAGPQGAPGDAPTLYPIINASSFTAAHGRPYPPETWLLSPTGEVVDTDTLHSPGAVTLVFPQPFTGSLYVR